MASFDLKGVETMLDPFEEMDYKYFEAKEEYKNSEKEKSIGLLNLLCEALNVKIEHKHSSIFDYSFSTNYSNTRQINLIKVIVDKNEFNERVIQGYKQPLISQQNDYVIYFVLFFKKNEKSEQICDQYRTILKDSNVLRNKDIRVLLFDDFVEEQFGETGDKYKEFMNELSQEIKNGLGYHAMPVPTIENLDSFKEGVKRVLLSFDYSSVKKKFYPEIVKKNPSVKDLDNSSFNYLLQNFKSRYEILFGSKDYAKSFITSAWLYKHYYVTDTLDNTFIISGYIKAIESFMNEFIEASDGSNDFKSFISHQNLKDIKNLGAFEFFLSNWYTNSRYFSMGIQDKTEGLRNYQNYFRTIVKIIREEYRNNSFHTDSLEKDRINDIRDLCVYTFMILIGGLNIPLDSEVYNRLKG